MILVKLLQGLEVHQCQVLCSIIFHQLLMFSFLILALFYGMELISLRMLEGLLALDFSLLFLVRCLWNLFRIRLICILLTFYELCLSSFAENRNAIVCAFFNLFGFYVFIVFIFLLFFSGIKEFFYVFIVFLKVFQIIVYIF